MLTYGLKEKTIKSIKHVFSFFPEVEKVIIYGSRAKGNYKNGSDIDLTLVGEKLNLSIQNKIELALDELVLPYTFDISIYNHISSSSLLNHIERVGILFFTKNK